MTNPFEWDDGMEFEDDPETIEHLLPTGVADQADAEARSIYHSLVSSELSDRLANNHRLSPSEMATALLMIFFSEEDKTVQEGMLLKLTLALMHRVYVDVQDILDGADGNGRSIL